MEINALMMDVKDNVVTCVKEVAQGQSVIYMHGDELRILTAEETIPYCHKVALENIEEGRDVIKYGESIGVATMPIVKGYWVSHMNVVSVPRDYDSEMI